MLKLVKRPGSEVWYVRGTVRGIRCFETSGTSERDKAETFRAKREAELYDQAVFGVGIGHTFAQAALSYLDFAERTVRTKTYVAQLVDHFGNARLAGIGQEAADKAVVAIVGQQAKPSTKTRIVYTPLAAILNHAAERGWCGRPKFRKPPAPRGKTRWLSPTEAIALMEAAAPHLRPLLHFYLCTGARVSEALDLDWEDVDLGAATVRLRDTKNGFDRIAALPEAGVITLANLPGDRCGKVFRRDDGEPYADRERLEGGQIKTAFRGACKRAGIVRPVVGLDGKPKLNARGKPMVQPTATPHDLRHTWASWFYALTKDPLLLKAEGGWRILAMVERYAHLMPSGLIPEISQIWGPSHPRIGPLPLPGCAIPVQSANGGQNPA